MSKRIEIENQIFNDIYVLKFNRNKKSHAEYRCLCMLCNSLMFATYTNLMTGNTKSCQSCGQKRISNGVEQDIFLDLKNGSKITHVAKKYNVGRSVAYRIRREFEMHNIYSSRTDCNMTINAVNSLKEIDCE